MQTTRLLLVAAAVEGILGLGIYLLPGEFQVAHYAPLSPYFPYLSSALVVGAVVLISLARYAWRPAVQRAAVLIPALPLVILGYTLGRAGLKVAPFIYTGLGLGVFMAPWFPPAESKRNSDLFDLVVGAIQLVIGSFMLVSPESYTGKAYAAINAFLPAVGVTGLVGAITLLHPVGAGHRWCIWFRRFAGAAFPCLIMYNSYWAGLTIGTISWGILATASLIGYRRSPGSAGLREPSKGSLQDLDRSLETWSWLLALAVVLANVSDPGAAGTARQILVNVFVLAVTLYTTLAHWVFPTLGTPEQRNFCHLTFLSVNIGLLTGAADPGGHAFLVLLVIPPVLGARSLGPNAGVRILIVAMVSAALGDVRDVITGLFPASMLQLAGHVAGQSLLLGAAGLLGVRHAKEQWNLMVDLTAARMDLQRQVKQLRLIDQIGSAIRSSLDLTVTLHTTVAELGRVLAACRCNIYQMSPEGLLNLACEHTAPGASSMAAFGADDLAVAHLVAANQQVVAVTDIRTDRLPEGAPEGLRTGLLSMGTRSILAVPILAEGHLLGIITFHECNSPRAWRAEEIDFVDALAGQVGVALLHARAHGELQRQRDRLTAALKARRAAEEALRESEQRFRSAFGEAPIGMALAAVGGQWEKVNRSLADMLGYTAAELEGMKGPLLTHPDDLEVSHKHAREITTGAAQSCRYEKRYIHRNGHTVWALVSASAIQDEAGKVAYAILHIQDITEQKRAEAQLLTLANYDTLTGLFNRYRFQTELDRELTHGAMGALLFLDLDQFKYVNDTLGHLAGDDLLRSVATLLQQHLGPSDIMGRLSGDEFAILLPQADGHRARQVAEELLELLRRHITIVGSRPVTVRGSIGIALYPEHGTSSEEILARADLAMYQVKEQGRNGLEMYRPDQNEQAQMESKLTWEGRIREALELDQFIPYFQPILDLHSSRVVRYEMLLRLRDRQGQVVLPGAFLGVAERFGLIHAVDRWVVQRAIRLIAEQERVKQPICLEINLSGKAFADSELLPLIRREIARTGINPASLIMEITETAAITDTNLARLFVEDLASLGCRFAIDDFGAGFSSFSYLKDLPVDYLKIDGSFIRNLPRDPVDQHLVRTMVDLARGLGKKTIAEFVGDRETLSLLQEYGVDFAQGYFIGRPCPLEEQVETIW